MMIIIIGHRIRVVYFDGCFFQIQSSSSASELRIQFLKLQKKNVMAKYEKLGHPR